MGHHDHLSLVIFQHRHQLVLQPLLEVLVQSGEGFIQQDQIRLVRHDPGQSDPLLLPAGKLSRKMVFQSLQVEPFDHFPDPVPAPGAFSSASAIPVPAAPAGAPETRGDVLFDGHRRKQGVVLEHVAHVSLLRFQIDLFRGVEKEMVRRLIVAGPDHDPSPVRLFDAGDAFERHAFAAAGRPQNPDTSRIAGKCYVELEIPEFFVNIDEKSHATTV